MNFDHNRRQFLGNAAATTAFTMVPRHVLGGAGFVAPSDKITLAYIGIGTQGLREMLPMLAIPDIQIVSVCDPSKEAVAYRDWSQTGIRNSIRKVLGKPDWGTGFGNEIPGGRDVGKDVVDAYYSNQRSGAAFKGCSAYADFRELLDKEKDLNAVKVITPDHLHGIVSIAAMKKGKHVIMHKPISNRLKEARLVIDTAHQKGVATHFQPWDSNGSMARVMAWIKEGAIGTLREVHNWTNRPVWPQYTTLPADTPPIPDGFNWDLWLGPEADRPYHPNYTHMVFRSWYDFGGGCMADMGHYSLWTVFNALELGSPLSVEPLLSHHCIFNGNTPSRVKNDFSFPTSAIVRFKFAARGERKPVDLFWYDGGMKPPTPEEMDEDQKEFALEAMMFVGDKGRILSGFHVDNPRLIPDRRMRGYETPPPPPRQQRQAGEVPPGMKQWIEACRGGAPSPGSFVNAWPISEAVNLYAVALRTGKRLLWDAENMKITNLAEANKYLARDYRKGWEPESV